MPPLTPALVLTAIWGAYALVHLVLGFALRGHRISMWLAALLAASAAGAAWAAGFWPMVILGLLALTSTFAAIPVLDMSWRMRCALNVGVVSLGFLALWPTLDGMSGGKLHCPAYIKEHVSFRLVAGLDLRGGLRLVYTVDVEEAVKDKRDHYHEDMRTELTRVFDLHKGDERPTEESYAKLREKVELEAPRQPVELLRLRLKPGADPSKIDERFLEHFRSELSYTRSQDGRTYEFRIRSSVESSIRDRAVGQAREIINRRIDEMGLREAAVSTRDEDIIVEVPGEDEKAFASIRDIISQTARLEFKLLDDDSDFFRELREKAKPESLPEGLDFSSEQVSVGLDKGGDAKTRVVTYAFLNKNEKETIQQTYQRMKEWLATLELPADREVGLEVVRRTVDQVTMKEEDVGWRTYLLKTRAEVTGDMVRDASAQPDQSQGSMGGWHVQLMFTEQGGRIFERITGDNIKRRFAIILDGKTASAPVIQSRIAGGNAQITLGSNDPEAQLRDAKKLELVLRSGALPAPISPSNEQRIGPSLGRDAIDLGVQGALGGSALVLVFMVIYYSRAGLIADIAVIMNLFLQLAVLASFGASMTLPGIAGLALTIGMSVDANVLINERIREELDLGKSARAAVEIGYKRAFSAIFDGHVTSVIAGVVLAQYGTGPIKGFAATLLVGVVCSLFTGVMMTRVMFDLWVRFLGRQGKLALG
ncbi:MAG TPA: protein translocase subunit SecD [Polyangiaceae bacterium]|nr:protein translocase subunit SecD [Polyangiaceae bacterium]